MLLQKCMEYQGELYYDKKYALEIVIFAPKEIFHRMEICSILYLVMGDWYFWRILNKCHLSTLLGI